MCGRYVVVSNVEVIEKRFQVKAPEKVPELFPNYNVGPVLLLLLFAVTNQTSCSLSSLVSLLLGEKKIYLFNARSEGDSNKENDRITTAEKELSINLHFVSRSVHSAVWLLRMHLLKEVRMKDWTNLLLFI